VVLKNINQVWLETIIKKYKPAIIGISAMLFQIAEAAETSEIIKKIDSNITTIMGGYAAASYYDQVWLSDYGQH